MSKITDRPEFQAITIDEQTNATQWAELIKFDSRPLRLTYRDPAAPDRTLDLKARVLSGQEVIEYYKRLGKINPDFRSAKNTEDVLLTPEQNEQLYDLFDEYINKSTGIPIAELKKRTMKLRAKLFAGIMSQSTPTKEEIEDIKKFRAD